MVYGKHPLTLDILRSKIYPVKSLLTNTGKIYLQENDDFPILYINSKDDVEKLKVSMQAR